MPHGVSKTADISPKDEGARRKRKWMDWVQEAADEKGAIKRQAVTGGFIAKRSNVSDARAKGSKACSKFGNHGNAAVCAL